ncbi:MAG: hypothetical protein ACYDC6_16330 [Acidobacteriaceae bacterium]
MTVLRPEPGVDKLREQACSLARLLEEKATILVLASQLSLIQEMWIDAFRDDIPVAFLDKVRRKLRILVK